VAHNKSYNKGLQQPRAAEGRCCGSSSVNRPLPTTVAKTTYHSCDRLPLQADSHAGSNPAVRTCIDIEVRTYRAPQVREPPTVRSSHRSNKSGGECVTLNCTKKRDRSTVRKQSRVLPRIELLRTDRTPLPIHTYYKSHTESQSTD
jgi:hypothetical protein